jgi:hypothetical protein
VIRLTNIPASQFIIDKIYDASGVDYFNNDFRPILQDVINELYYSHGELIFQLRLNHIDRAIFKFRQAKQNNFIHNTKQYFKACIVSAIRETALDNLEP